MSQNKENQPNGKIYKYTLILFVVAVLFIVIGGISIGRVSEYQQNNQASQEIVETVDVRKSEYDDLSKHRDDLVAEKQQIVDILYEEITDEEKIDKIETVLFEQTRE